MNEEELSPTLYAKIGELVVQVDGARGDLPEEVEDTFDHVLEQSLKAAKEIRDGNEEQKGPGVQ